MVKRTPIQKALDGIYASLDLQTKDSVTLKEKVGREDSLSITFEKKDGEYAPISIEANVTGRGQKDSPERAEKIAALLGEKDALLGDSADTGVYQLPANGEIEGAVFYGGRDSSLARGITTALHAISLSIPPIASYSFGAGTNFSKRTLSFGTRNPSKGTAYRLAETLYSDLSAKK